VAESDDTGVSRTLVSGVNASGNLTVDKTGNAYVPVQNKIYKIEGSTPSVFIQEYLNAPKDVAVDPRNGDLYVLDGGEIKRFDKNGEFIVNFGSGALDAVSICIDEEGTLFVADFSRDYRSAQVIKFEPAPVVDASSVTAPAAMDSGMTDTLPTDTGSDLSLDLPELPQ